ncbi:MAG TPA: DUF2231 domain-containing protein [Sphingomicrobium sp.]|nr:DUF2231 domain-containing protein [Sphingomicrobium sp.]
MPLIDPKRVLRNWLAAAFAALVLSIAIVPTTASAHEEHRRQQQLAAQAAAQQRARAAAAGNDAQAMHETMGEMMMPRKDRSRMGLAERLLDWLGRTHPVIVHFPIAFFPAALFTAVVGRRRPAFSAPVQFLVVAGGIIAPISALFGWFNGGFSLTDSDPLLTVHRWLGTAIGIGGLALAAWAWRRPWEDRRGPMIAALAVMTAMIVVQGWYGGALVHGMDHMDW